MGIGTITMGRDALRAAAERTEARLGRSATPTELAIALSDTIRSPISWNEANQAFVSTEEALEDEGMELLLEYATLFVLAQRSSPVELLASSLTYSEKRVALAILDSAMGRKVFTVNGVALSRKMGAARSFVTACLSKIKTSGIMDVRSLGAKGTRIRILDVPAAERARARFARDTKDDPFPQDER